MTKNTDKPVFALTTGRIEALTDGIFAIAMTLLVLNLVLPDDAAQQANIGLHNLLYSQVAKFLHYVLAFMLLSIFWIAHHQQFHWIKRTDSRLLWINIVILMFVALMPFSTDIVGDFGGNITANVFFASNLLILGILFTANWAYATRNHRLVDPEVDRRIITQALRRNMVTPVVSAIVIVLSFFIPQWSLWLYLLIPIFLAFEPLINRRKS